ncbi:MAG TPA: hypothetical protein VGE09_14020, partial [Pseudoxanthomonas sp.]
MVGTMRHAQRDQGIHVMTRGQHTGAMTIRMARDDVQRRSADRARRAEDRHIAGCVRGHAQNPKTSLPSTKMGSAARTPSM